MKPVSPRNIVLRIIISLLVICFLILSILPFFGYRNYIVESSSMHPAIPKFSIVYVKVLDEDEKRELQVDEVIAISTSDKPLLHRIIKIDEETVTTQGDKNNGPDKPVGYEKIIGRNVLTIPFIGILFLNIYPGLIMVMAIIIFFITKEIVKEIRKK